MSIRIHVHKTHRKYTDGLEVIEVDGKTVGDCIQGLVKRFQGLKEQLFEKNGKLKHTIEIYLNHESAYPDELLKPVNPGDEIHITVMLAGG